jgi:hypothetical protein
MGSPTFTNTVPGTAMSPQECAALGLPPGSMWGASNKSPMGSPTFANAVPGIAMSPQECAALGLPPGSMWAASNKSGAQNGDASATAAEQKAKRAAERRSNFLAAMQAETTTLAAYPGSPLRAHDFGLHCVSRSDVKSGNCGPNHAPPPCAEEEAIRLAGWNQDSDKAGKPYWVNHNTQEWSWDSPILEVSGKPLNLPRAPAPSPPPPSANGAAVVSWVSCFLSFSRDLYSLIFRDVPGDPHGDCAHLESAR